MFWSGYSWWKHLSSPSALSSHAVIPPDPPPLSEGVQLRILTDSDFLTERALLERVCTFLYDYFATQPRLVFQPDTLLPPRDHLLILQGKDASLLGTIRYHFIGHLHTPVPTPEGPCPIYLVDAFCLHSDHRRKGWGSVLLAELHCHADRQGIPHALFLKEGTCLPVLPLPMYSGRYVYRHLDSSQTASSQYVRHLNSTHAMEWIAIYHTCQPHTLMITSPNTECEWRVYYNDHRWVLACFQDTHQRWITPHQEERMGWCTVWLESPDLTPEQRHEASLLLSDSVATHFDWVWMNRKWTSGMNPWIEDGGFHWYTYQWTTNLSMAQSYALMG